MIEEDYVSFETAKLLKEKGFDIPSFNPEEWPCCMYDEEGKLQWGSYSDDWCCRVTFQMTMKWLREVHNKHCDVGICKDGWFYDIFDTKVLTGDFYQEVKCYNSKEGFNSYEDAAEAAIKYCLENLI